MKKIEIFRIENPITMNGMWYTEKSEWNPFIFKLSEGISKDLPMEYDPRYHKGGDWYSACNSTELMKKWFSKQDAIELSQNGYKLFRFEVDKYKIEENQTLFLREGIITKAIINIDKIWN